MSAKTEPDNLKCLRFRRQIEQLVEKPGAAMGASLARHIETCPSCREYADEIAAAHYLLDRVKWRSMPAGTLALCNRQALKKLERQVRTSPKGAELAAAKPDSPAWEQAVIRISRGGVGIAAGLAVLAANWAVTSGLDQTQKQFQNLAQIHQKNHIGDWDDPDGTLA